MVVGVQTQQRRGTASQWSASGKILAAGEMGVTTDTKIIKIGDGVNTWDNLPVAFSSLYLTVGGTAADSALLGGISSSGFVKTVDATTAATGDKVAKRFSDGRLKAATGVSTDDVANVAQMVSADTAAVTTARQELVVRTVTAAFTLQLADAGGLVVVNNNSYTTFAATIPPNSSVAFPIGSFVDIRTGDKGPVTLTAGAGVTLSGHVLIYGGGSYARLLKTGTDTWTVLYTSLSAGPLLRRKILTGTGLMGSGFTKMSLNGAGTGFADNADTLGSGEQYNAATDVYKVTCRRSGWYDVGAQITVASSIAGRIYIKFKVNNTDQHLGAGWAKGSVADTGPGYRDKIPLNVGDYIEVYAFQEAVGSADVSETNDSASMFYWRWERPL